MYFQKVLVKGCHFHYAQNIWKKVEKYNLVKLSKEENIRRQIANIIALPLVSSIIAWKKLWNYDLKLDKLTDYVIKNYIEDVRFSLSMWNHFDNIGERPRTNNHLEGCHRQLNAKVRTNPDLWMWINEAKSSEEAIMSKNKH